MKKHFSLIFAIFVFIIFANVGADACWCRKDSTETNTEENFRKTIARKVETADFVFSGTPVEKDGTRIVFKVEDVWKGDFKDSITFYVQDGFIDSCDFIFEVGKTYLVYAYVTIEGFSASKCGRTNFLDKAQRDLNELNRRELLGANFSEPFSLNF